MRKKILPFVSGLVAGYIGARLYSNRKPSTKEFAKFHLKNPLQFLHGYVYFRWPEQYLRIVNKALDKPAAVPRSIYETCGNYLTETHHSKVIPIEQARRLIKIEKEISLTNLEQVIPFERARDLIIKNPDHIVVADCMCRAIKENPCRPIDVCIAMGEPFAGFILEHRPESARLISRDEAVSILEREHQRGRFHTAWFKDAAGDRFYSICSCCSCCCLGMKAYNLFDKRVITSSGYVAQVDEEICEGCASCSQVCSFGAVSVDDKAQVDREICMGCGLCGDKCEHGAITLHLDPSKPKPLDVSKLI